jgi:MFS family permease
MAVGMFMAHAAHAVTELTIWRFITGLGIGGMLAATNAVTAECSSRAGRSLAMALYVIGYPLGAVIGGFVAQGWLLVDYDWRAVFLFGAVVTAVMIPLVMLLVPETPAFFAATRPAGALDKINRSLAAFRQPRIEAMPPEAPAADKPRIRDILVKPRLRKVTLLLAFGYMFHTITFYFVLKWAVQFVADFGYSQPQAASVLTWANIGGAMGGFLFGFLMKKWDIKTPTIVMLLLGAVAVAAFGFPKDNLWGWRMATFATGFFTNAAIVGYYSAYARGFPAYARATGTGLVLGVGRLGAAGSPILAGLLFTALGKEQLVTVSVIMAAGSVVAALLLFALPLRDADRDMAEAGAGTR